MTAGGLLLKHMEFVKDPSCTAQTWSAYETTCRCDFSEWWNSISGPHEKMTKKREHNERASREMIRKMGAERHFGAGRMENPVKNGISLPSVLIGAANPSLHADPSARLGWCFWCTTNSAELPRRREDSPFTVALVATHSRLRLAFTSRGFVELANQRQPSINQQLQGRTTWTLEAVGNATERHGSRCTGL